jgi:NAD(P)-dependent dehydrogenase (short-subunit alcohol dehydrogenase family)
MADKGTALVTGAAQGLGLATARRLAADGYRVVMADRQGDRLQAAAAEIADAKPYVLDLLAVDEIGPLVSRVEDECGPLVALVNNAGIVKTHDFLDATLQDWEMIMGVNARAPFVFMQQVGGRMVIRGHGAIVNICSVAARSARPVQAIYGASKAALLHLTKSAAAAFGPHGVRVNAICPGVMRTEMTEQIWRDRRPEDVQQILRTITLGRTADPSEMAAAVAWLLSDEAGYVNGQALNVCGGMEMD